MATKKASKAAPKKAAKPAPKAVVKAAPKKAAKPVAKPAAAKAPVKKAAKPAATKTAKAAPVKAAKPIAAKAAAKPAAKKAAKPAPKAVKTAVPAKAAKPAVAEKKQPEKAGKPVKAAKAVAVVEHENSKLVSIKPKPKTSIKKEPAPPANVTIPKIVTKSAIKYEPDFTKSVLDNKTHNTAPAEPTMRYSDSDLQEFREIIARKLDAAKKELSYLQGLITRRDEGGDFDEGRFMTMEDGSVSMEREQLSQMASRQITFIDHLEKAMIRIENKTYGICRVTGQLIDKARLRAVPHATLSMEAKSSMKK